MSGLQPKAPQQRLKKVEGARSLRQRFHEDGLLEKVQERSVQVEELQLLREAIAKCSAQTQVNAPQLCRPLVIDYLKRVQKLDYQYQFKLDLDD